MHPRFKLASFATASVMAIASLGALNTDQLDGNLAILDWNEVDIADFPALPDGRSFDQIATVGSYPAVGEMTLEEVVPDGTTIGQIDGLDDVRLGDLAGSVPNLNNQKVKDSPAIAKIVESFVTDKANQVASHYAQKYADKLIGEIFKDIPALKDLPLGDFKGLLSGDPLSAIPGLAQTALDKIPGLDKVALDKIPGMDKLPLNKILDLARYSPVAILDSVYGAEETKSTYKPISGTEQDGYSIPCNQTNCTYIELEDYKGSLKGVLKPADLLTYHGARWNAGGPDKSKGQMMGKGGSGILGATYLYKEPVGRPLGDDLSIVLMSVSQPKGNATFGIFTRVCGEFIGCTPKMIGPIFTYTIAETDLVFLGTPDYKLKKGVMPKWASSKMAGILDKFSPPGDSYGGGGFDTAQQQADCAQKVLSTMDPASSAKGQSFVPTMVSEALSAGYTADQTALFVAIAEDKYGFNVDPKALMSQYGKTAKAYVTDKFVNFYSATSVTGLADSTAVKAGNYQGALKPCKSANCSASGTMIKPSNGPVTSEFGMRLSPTLGVWRLHAGIDVGDGVGVPIRAADCGTVAYSGWEDGYGNVVVLNHGKYFTRHAHASKLMVSKGQKVKQGDVVILAGASGRVTGPHLHFEVRDGAPFGTPLNPRRFINFN